MNLKNTTDILEENQHHLYIACNNSRGNFVVPNFWFHFWKSVEKWIHLFLREWFPNFWDLTGGTLEPWNTLFTESILKSRFFLKFYSCVTCVKISVTIVQDWLCFIWSISIARLWMFLWWTETDPSFSRCSS